MSIKIIYIIFVCLKNYHPDISFIVNKYLSIINNLGDKYSIINASLTAFYVIKKYENIIINYNYYNGLLLCLNQSSKWDDIIRLYYHKNLLYKIDICEIVIHLIKYFHDNINDEGNNNLIIDILHRCKLKGLQYYNFIIYSNSYNKIILNLFRINLY